MANNNPAAGSLSDSELTDMDLPEGVLEHINYLTWKEKDVQIKYKRLEKKNEANRKKLELAEQRIKELEQEARNQPMSGATATGIRNEGIDKEKEDTIIKNLKTESEQDTQMNLSKMQEEYQKLKEELETKIQKLGDEKISGQRAIQALKDEMERVKQNHYMLVVFARGVKEVSKFPEELDCDQLSSEYLQRLLAKVKKLLDHGLKDDGEVMTMGGISSEFPLESGVPQGMSSSVSSISDGSETDQLPLPSSSNRFTSTSASQSSVSTLQPVEIVVEGGNAEDSGEDSGSHDNFIDELLRVPTPQPSRRRLKRVPANPSSRVSTAVPRKPTNRLSTAVPPKPSSRVSTAVPPEPTKRLSTAVPPIPSSRVSTAVPPKPTKRLSTAVPPRSSKRRLTSAPVQPTKRQLTRVSRQPKRFSHASYIVYDVSSESEDEDSCQEVESSEEEISSEELDSSEEPDVSEEEVLSEDSSEEESGKSRDGKANQEIVASTDMEPGLRRTRLQQLKRGNIPLTIPPTKPNLTCRICKQVVSGGSAPWAHRKIVHNKDRRSGINAHPGIPSSAPTPAVEEPMEVDDVRGTAVDVESPTSTSTPPLAHVLIPGSDGDSEDERLKCKCGKTFETMSGWKRHHSNETYGRIYRCCICQKTFLTLHSVRTHNPKCYKPDLRGFQCGHCPQQETRQYLSKDSIEEHWQAQHSSQK